MFRVRQFPKFFFRSTSSISQIQSEKLQKFKDQIPKSDRFYAKIDYLNLPVRQEFSGTKPIRIEEIEEKIISKLTQNGHPIKDIHMRHFTDRYTLEVMRIRDKHIADGFIQFFVEFEKEESVWNLLPCEESLIDGSTTYDLKFRNGHGSSDIESLLDDDIMISRLSQAQYLEHINFEEEIEKFKEQYPNYIHVYLTVRDLKTGNRAEFVNKSDIINYINEKVFEGRDENYMVLEAYAGKYSIWLSNKEAAQDFWTSVYTNNYGILKDDLTLQPNGDVTLEAHVGACSIVLTSQKVESVPVTKKQKVMRKFKVRKQQTKFIKQVDETEIELDEDDF